LSDKPRIAFFSEKQARPHLFFFTSPLLRAKARKKNWGGGGGSKGSVPNTLFYVIVEKGGLLKNRGAQKMTAQ